MKPIIAAEAHRKGDMVEIVLFVHDKKLRTPHHSMLVPANDLAAVKQWAADYDVQRKAAIQP